MGIMVNGTWQVQDSTLPSEQGRFVRMDSGFRNWITPDGRPGPSGEGGFAAESGRYHLYVSLACPWAHRTLLFRHLKGLEGLIGLSIVHPHMGEQGWSFASAPGTLPDPVGQACYLHEVYRRARQDYSGKVTVPVLWDWQRDTIVSNESADIIRMLNAAFDGLGATAGDYAPADLLPEIDAINAFVYARINNGVYKAGFATDQAVYAEEVSQLFDALDQLELRLGQQRYLVGEHLTEADWRLFTTLIRFDSVYHGHFKCNLRRVQDYPKLWDWTRALYQTPGVAETVNFDHIKQHYYRSHHRINPNGIVPLGPCLDLLAPSVR